MHRTELTKRRLYDATIELVGSRGIDETSVDDIVELAGVAKATVYYHFTGKAELVDAVLTNRSEQLIGEFEQVAAEYAEDPSRAIDELVRVQFEYLNREPRFSKVLTTELWRTDRPWHSTLIRTRKRLTDTICRVLKQGVTTGVFRDDIDPDFGGYALFGLVSYTAMDRMLHDPDHPAEEMLRQLLRLVHTSIEAHCRRGPAEGGGASTPAVDTA